MGSLNFDGTQKTQSVNIYRVHHQGDFLKKTNTKLDSGEVIVSSGIIDTRASGLIGVMAHPDATLGTTVGLSTVERNAFTSVEREKFTQDGTDAGNLVHDVVRKPAGNFVSISNRQAILAQNRLTTVSGASVTQLVGGDALGPMQTIRERKVFFNEVDRVLPSGGSLSDWTIYDAAGDAVGTDDGITDTDVTPNDGLLGL